MSRDTLDLGVLEVNEFAEFWTAYPRHKDRARAEVAYRRARHIATAEEILNAARAYAASVAGQPAEHARWAVEWLRAEPWKPDAAPVPPRPPTRVRRRRNPSVPLRAPHAVTRVRESAEDQKAKWCRQHGVTLAEYEQRKGDKSWLDRVILRGIVA